MPLCKCHLVVCLLSLSYEGQPTPYKRAAADWRERWSALAGQWVPPAAEQVLEMGLP